jgi:phosphatidylglycerol:prolipoprotein diacylglycerol transferase
VAFSLGGFEVRWYGVVICLGLLLAVLYAWFNSKKYDVDNNKLIDCALVGIVSGIIGARLYYVLFNFSLYADNPIEILYINEGGLAIYGGIIGGLLGGIAIAKLHKMNIPALLDIAVMGFLIGQALGRWGNFFNQEAFGSPTNLPWGMISENTGGVAVHPCFLYESLWCALGFVLFHFLRKKLQNYRGEVFLWYLVWYGFERTFVEGLRTDSLYLFGSGIRVSQLLSALLAVVGAALIVYFRKRKDEFYKG